MGARPADRVALMAIHPRYAEAILAGTKKAEFRKRRMSADIDTVLIYATAPVKRIVGEFTIAETVTAPPSALWSRLRREGGIARTDFERYYASATQGTAFIVGSTRRYVSPVPLAALSPQPAVPQSFAYIGRNALPSSSRRTSRVRGQASLVSVAVSAKRLTKTVSGRFARRERIARAVSGDQP